MFSESLGPLLPFIIVAFNLTHTQAGRLGLIASLAYGVMNYPSGHWSDKYGKRIFILLSLILASAATLLMVFSTGYPQLLLLFGLSGFGGGLYHPPGTALLSTTFSKDTRGGVLGFHASGGALGILLAFVVVGGVATHWNWKVSLVCLSVVGFVLAVAIRVQLWDIVNHKNNMEQGGLSDKDDGLDLWTFFRWMPQMLILYGFVMFLTKGTYVWVPTYLKEAYHLSVGKAIVFSVIIPIIGIFSNYFMGRLSDHFGRKRTLVLIFLILALCFFLLSLGKRTILIPLLVIFGFFLNSFSGVINAYARDFLPSQVMGKAFGILFTFSICISAFAPYIMGIISDRSSLTISMYFLGVVSLVGALASIKTPKPMTMNPPMP